MNIFSSNRRVRAFVTILSAPKTDRLMRRVMLWALAIDIILLPALYVKLFVLSPITPVVASVTSVREKIEVGTATANFIQQLTNSSLTPVVAKNITRRPFTVEGKMVTLNGDNIQVFEYADNDTAIKDASILAKKYVDSTRSLAWKKDMHLYVNDTLVIFYMGHQSSIMSSLNQNAGLSLTQPIQSSSALSKNGI